MRLLPQSSTNLIKKNNIGLQIASYINRRGLQEFLSNAFLKVVCKIERIFLKRMSKFNKFFKKLLLNKEDYVSISVRPQISKNGLIYRYAKEYSNHIKELDLDLLILGGSGILRGNIFDFCPNGVISFHHTDNDINRGGPPGFWKVYFRSPRTRFVIKT